MNLFDRCSAAAIILATLFTISPASSNATPEQLVGASLNPGNASPNPFVRFTPPDFDYSPVSATVPLVEASTWQDIGENAVLTGDYLNALTAFDKAVQLASVTKPDLLEQRGWIHYSLGYEAEAVRDLALAARGHLSQGDFSAHVNAVNMRAFVEAQALTP